MPTVLSRASAYWKAAGYSGSGDLQDGSGNGLHAVLGAGAAAPKWLPYAGTKYAYNPGINANGLSAPDSAAFTVTGDLDLRVAHAAEDWTPAATGYLAGHFLGATNRAWRWFLNTDGTIGFVFSFDGSALATYTSSSNLSGQADAAFLGLRLTRNITSGDVEVLWKSLTESNWQAELAADAGWTSLGVSTLTAGALWDSSALLNIGGFQTNSAPNAGRYYGFRMSISGTVVASFDASQLTSPFATYVSPTGETWTLNRSATGRKLAVVDRSMFLLGTDDYFEVADNPLLDFGAGDSFTVAVAYRKYGAGGTGQTWIAKKTTPAASTVGWFLREWTGLESAFRFADGAVALTATTSPLVATPGVALLVAGVRDVVADTLHATVDGSAGTPVADTTTATLENALALRIGQLSAGSAPADFEFIGAAVFPEALSAADLATLSNEFLGIASLGLATETDSTFAPALRKSLTLGLASETDESFGLGTVKALTLGLALEENSALALALTKAATLGLAQEVDSAFAIGAFETITVRFNVAVASIRMDLRVASTRMDLRVGGDRIKVRG